MEDSPFYITLPSNASFHTFPQNEISNYTTKLAKPIDLKGEWEVALTEIQYLHTWNMFEMTEGKLFVGRVEGPVKTLYVKADFYSSVDELIDAITGNNNEMVTQRYVKPDYIPVSKRHFDRITIEIKSNQNRNVSFKYGKSIVKLHFRPCRYNFF